MDLPIHLVEEPRRGRLVLFSVPVPPSVRSILMGQSPHLGTNSVRLDTDPPCIQHPLDFSPRCVRHNANLENPTH